MSLTAVLCEGVGFTRETEPARPELLVTHCRWRPANWFAWSESPRILQIAECSHCRVCPAADECPCLPRDPMGLSAI